jgi:hypothetical protein
MPYFTVQVFKTHPFRPGRQNSNSYTLLAANMADAAAGVDVLKEYELELHDPNFTITYARLSTDIKGDDDYTTIVYNAPGVRVASGESLPLFNTMRLDVNAASGRPSRWHYRGLHEGEVSNNEVSSATRLVLTDAFEAMQTAMAALSPAVSLVQSDHTDLAAVGSSPPPVFNRKLTRRRKKSGI